MKSKRALKSKLTFRQVDDTRIAVETVLVRLALMGSLPLDDELRSSHLYWTRRLRLPQLTVPSGVGCVSPIFGIVSPWANRGGAVRSASVYGPGSTKLAIAGRDITPFFPSGESAATQEMKATSPRVALSLRNLTSSSCFKGGDVAMNIVSVILVVPFLIFIE
uniref:Uncharacterized protein n=1 Tax=Ananas comosus var. bracteatus TaxID=296719 RepID=A0A6V7PEG7_ANACO|nr:unnamed protein product [Ananas comosus var. bracteatus]